MPQAALTLFLLAGIFASSSLVLEGTRRTTDAIEASLSEEPPPPPPGEIFEVSILRLRAARYVRGRPLPKWIRELDGKRIRIWGHMALGTLEGETKFELVPESCECNRSKVNHFVDVTLTDGVTRFIPGRITIEGIFHASEVEEDGYVTSLYRLKIKELPQS